VRLRSCEWLIIGYFSYVAILAPVRIAEGDARWMAAALAAIVAAILVALAWRKSFLRDWIPLACTLAAYREMDWFTPKVQDHHFENAWIGWDRWLLDGAHVRAAIESAGALLPSYFEICYVLVYAVAPISLALLLVNHRRANLNIFWMAYLAGTLGAYALFPYFPSEPPRTVFPGLDLPHIVTVFRRFNLWILGNYGIHSSVFPSAHVSSAFASAWGLLMAIPERKRIGWMMALYAASVAIATIYGRYHYSADVVAGIATSLLAFLAVGVAKAYAARVS
jgi:membrane-associated phospholipid phosphatase